jgi:N-acetylmuramoyl-L-alanine amidase/Fungal chitosanase of glycosyl hydrolase group 75
MSFEPPDTSRELLEGIPFDQASDTTPKAKARYDAFDKTTAGKRDPSKCKALLQFPDRTVFWSAKLAVDADGASSAPGRPDGRQLDPGSGRGEITLTFSNGAFPSSEGHHYIVLPQGWTSSGKNNGQPFHPDLTLGDVAIVIYGNKITAAICGDLGPNRKIGEASIRVHEDFHPPAPDPCKERHPRDKYCVRILNSSIDEDVLVFVFPGTSFAEGLTPSTIESKVKERAFARFNQLKGLSGPLPLGSSHDEAVSLTTPQPTSNLSDLIAALENHHGSNNPHTKPAVELIQSPHRSSRNGAKITTIVVHCTEIPLKETVELFANPNSKRQVSAHYVIGRGGEIIQMVNDNERANHCKGANSNSIGVEHVGTKTDTMTPAQETASVALIRWLLEQYDIPRKRIFGHDFTPGRETKTSCPDKLFGPQHTQTQVQAWVEAHV